MTVWNSTGTSGSDATGQQPRAPRKNLLLSATIEAGTLSAPVRIRNLSETGAMLDGVALPEQGVRLVLRRSAIEVAATAMWRTDGRCGIRFDDSVISVDEWVAGARAPSFQGYKGQARVDAIQSAVRSGTAPPAEIRPSGDLSAAELERRVADEIQHVQQLLETLGEELIEDPDVLAKHLQALQKLDRASQMLEHVGTILRAADRVAAARSINMEDLRERLTRPAPR